MIATVTVFAGPTIEPRRVSGVVWRGPAAAGDLLRLSEGSPHKVLLIDGCFETTRAPWHKEILTLLGLGFAVSGAASLGALRAAELTEFGMQPIGGIANAYASGRIVGDDEVAVVHAPAELGYRALSVAHIDVRAMLVLGVRGRQFGIDEARRIARVSRGIFFKERSWPLVAERANMAAASSRWFLENTRSYKARDAELALNAVVAAPFSPTCRPFPPETVFLSRLRSEVHLERPLRPAP